jgi:hypothetical protein
MDERVVSYPLDLILDLQFSPLQFRNFQVVGGWVGKCFVEFEFQRFVTSLKLRKMRFNRHVAYLLAMDSCLTPARPKSKRSYSNLGPPKIPLCEWFRYAEELDTLAGHPPKRDTP